HHRAPAQHEDLGTRGPCHGERQDAARATAAESVENLDQLAARDVGAHAVDVRGTGLAVRHRAMVRAAPPWGQFFGSPPYRPPPTWVEPTRRTRERGHRVTRAVCGHPRGWRHVR